MLNEVKLAAYRMLKGEHVALPEGNRAFVFLAADYGNIGDIAITIAQEKFLRDRCGYDHVITVPISKTLRMIDSIRKQIGRNDLVTVIGGGNMGRLYPDIERLRRLVVTTFPDNRIVCFPQSVDTLSSQSSAAEAKAFFRPYAAHRDLYMFAREPKTYETLSGFGLQEQVDLQLVPDVVLSLAPFHIPACSASDGSVGLIALRHDQERLISTSETNLLETEIDKLGIPIEKTDTHVGGHGLPPALSEQLFGDKLLQIARARFLVTDRLHGMILAYLTNTPCGVVPNANHKVRSTHEHWLATSQAIVPIDVESRSTIEQSLSLLKEAILKPRSCENIVFSEFVKLEEACSLR